MKRRGFTTILALVLVALAAAALSTIAIALHLEQKRTHLMQTRAALRQLLLAGTTDALARAPHWPGQFVAVDWSVQLPPELSGRNVKLSGHLEPRGAADAELRLHASIEGETAEQDIFFHHDQSGWAAQSASLRS